MRGYKSRKLTLAYVAMSLITAAFFLTGIFKELVVAFPEYCMALLGAAAIYSGTNVASKLTANKPLARVIKPAPKEEEKEDLTNPNVHD